MHPYPPISYPSTRYDHQLTDFATSMLPPLSSFRPEEQKPTFDNELSIMEIHTAPDLGPILNPFELNHL
jgi:sorbitol-specific phosphotransferase system component IIC